MRKVTIMGLVLVLALSAMITGTILAQDDTTDDTTTTTATAWLGIYLTETDGVVSIQRVSKGSPAEDSGLLAGDIIVSVDDQAIESADALIAIVQGHQPGDTISVTISRDDSEQVFEITLGSYSARHHDGSPTESDPLNMAERVLRVELSAVDAGYQVVADRGLADDTLVVDDVITAVNDTPVTEVDWQTLLTDLTGQDNPVLTLTVQRGGEEIAVEITQFGGLNGHGGPRDDRGGRGHDDGGRPDQSGAPNDHGSKNDDTQDASPAVPDTTPTESADGTSL